VAGLDLERGDENGHEWANLVTAGLDDFRP